MIGLCGTCTVFTGHRSGQQGKTDGNDFLAHHAQSLSAPLGCGRQWMCIFSQTMVRGEKGSAALCWDCYATETERDQTRRRFSRQCRSCDPAIERGNPQIDQLEKLRDCRGPAARCPAHLPAEGKLQPQALPGAIIRIVSQFSRGAASRFGLGQFYALPFARIFSRTCVRYGSNCFLRETTSINSKMPGSRRG